MVFSGMFDGIVAILLNGLLCGYRKVIVILLAHPLAIHVDTLLVLEAVACSKRRQHLACEVIVETCVHTLAEDHHSVVATICKCRRYSIICANKATIEESHLLAIALSVIRHNELHVILEEALWIYILKTCPLVVTQYSVITDDRASIQEL